MFTHVHDASTVRCDPPFLAAVSRLCRSPALREHHEQRRLAPDRTISVILPSSVSAMMTTVVHGDTIRDPPPDGENDFSERLYHGPDTNRPGSRRRGPSHVEDHTASWTPSEAGCGGHASRPGMPVVGDILAGRFLLAAVLGRGGSGTVFAGRSISIPRSSSSTGRRGTSGRSPWSIPAISASSRASPIRSGPRSALQG